jgi:hypothetical protein
MGRSLLFYKGGEENLKPKDKEKEKEIVAHY